MMYSLPAKVLEVDATNKTMKVQFRCQNVVDAKIHNEKKILVGNYVSIIRNENEYEMSGDVITPAQEW